jgi:hypothetical protein
MPSYNRFAAGKYAWGMCDICAIRCRYRDLKPTTIRGHITGLRACPTCWDLDHPQNFLPYYVTTDAQALRFARPDTGLAASRQMYPPGNWPPYPPPPAGAAAEQQREQQAFRAAEQGAGGEV